MKRILRGAAMSIGVAGRAFVALVGICGVVAALANYTMTQGAGTTFGSVVVATNHYVQMMLCDLTTPAQCAAVSAAGAVKVDGSAVTQPVSGTVTANAGTNLNTSALSTSANQTSQITQETATAAALGTTADAACATDNGTCTVEALIKRTNQNLTTVNTTAGAAVPTGANVIGQVGSTSQYPFGAVPITASATGTTAATTATLAASASIKTYICGFSIRANATAAATANSTVTGTITGTLNYTQWTAPNASGLGLTEQVFMPCVPSSAINTAIAVISAAPGTGGVVSVSAWGYQL